ncbi:MAG: FtsX-like permease family protein [Pseudomonadota bacterium]|nr:FtsX-like permease family protein [Pseudomonadota bacterium]
MGVLVSIALRNLVQSPGRTSLLALAIGLVTTFLVLLMSLSLGINENLVNSATTMSAGHVNVAGFWKPTTGTAFPIVTGVGEVRKVVEASTPGLDYIVERHRGWGKIVSETGAIQSGLSGLVAADEGRFFDRLLLAPEAEYKEGGSEQIFGDARRLSEDDTIVLFSGQAKRLGVSVGDVVTIKTETMSGASNTADVTVVAIARDLGLLSSFSVFVPKSVVLDLYQLNEDTTGALWVYLDDIEESEATMTVVRGALLDAGFQLRDHESNPFFFKFEAVQGEDWTGQKLDVTWWQDEVSFLTWVLTAFDTLSWFLTLILVVIIAVGIMNAMWNAVRERTREVGTMRAIGMSQRRVLILFLLESLFLGLGATVIGAALGAAIALGVDAARIPVPSDAVRTILLSNELHLAVHPQSLLVAILSLTLFTSLSALWPAIRASRLQPVKALTHTE